MLAGIQYNTQHDSEVNMQDASCGYEWLSNSKRLLMGAMQIVLFYISWGFEISSTEILCCRLSTIEKNGISFVRLKG